MNLTDFAPPEVLAAIQAAGKISFHAVGDTGAAKVNRFQTAATALGHESAVADAMTKEIANFNGPAFFFHLGDVIYDFGEAQYYYDQFYEPYRNYPAPILAITGNHDSFIVPGTAVAAQPLKIFMRNFCSAGPGVGLWWTPAPSTCGP